MGFGGRFETGDGLRGVGVVCVVVFHIAAGAAFLGEQSGFDAYGATKGQLFDALQLSIFVFFGLSAYLLSWPWLAHGLQGKRRPSAARYLRHRVFRILPAFWVACLIVLVFYGTSGSSLREVVAWALMLQVYDHGPVTALLEHAWSLGFEAAFYIALPILALVALRLRRRWLVLGFLAAVVILGAALAEVGLDDGIPVRQSPVGALLAFVPGVLVAWWDVQRGGQVDAGRVRVATWVLLIVSLVGYFFLFELLEVGSQPELVLGTSLGAAIVWACVLRQRAGLPAWRLLVWRPIVWIGERSFSIFLLHGIVFWNLRDVGAGQPTVLRYLAVNVLVSLPACIAAGAVLHALVERPALQWAHRRDKPRPPSPPAGPPTPARPEAAPAPVPAAVR